MCSKLIDIEVVKSRQELGLDFWESLLVMLASEAPKTLKVLQENLDRNDYINLSANAHKLKGMAANLGAEKLRSLNLKLEEGAIKSDRDDAELRDLLASIETTFLSSLEALKKL